MLLYEVKDAQTYSTTLDFKGARLSFFELLVNGCIDHCYCQLSFLDTPACLYKRFERSEYDMFRDFKRMALTMDFKDLVHLTDFCHERGMY